MKSAREQTTDQILAQELAKLAPAGGFGARFAAKFLRTETRSETLVLRMPAGRAREVAYSVLINLGRIQSTDGASALPILRAVIRAGSLNLNPAVVDLVISENSADECSINITASAKEGLVKQQTVLKAVQRVKEALLN